MSTFTPSQFNLGTLISAAVNVFYSVPASATGAQITALTITNSDGLNPHSVSIWLAPTNAVPTISSLLITRVLAPSETYVVYQAFQTVLKANQTIQAQADSSGLVSLKASGLLITG